jgi:hypothetical protein
MKQLLVLICAAAAMTAWLSTPSAKSHDPAPTPPDAVLAWNANAVAAVRASAPAKFQLEALIYMSYVQGAVYDAVTKLDGRYEPYHEFTATVAPEASVEAAVAAAAQTTLDHYLPDQQASVDAKYAAYIATLSGDVADGVAVGQAAANDMIAVRTDDGRGATTRAYGGIGPILPGQWQLQSPTQTAQIAWAATMRPFLLERASQFRVEPPPALDSKQYARDLNETQAYGALNSTVRTPDQTAIAYFWNAFSVNQYNATMQSVVAQHDFDLVDAARLFAMGNMVSADAGIACWDSKYFYEYWRPITAIRNADKDGNDATTADPSWAPLLNTPTHPEYPSAHGCLTSGVMSAIAAALHTQRIDVTIPGAQGGATTLTTTQHFDTVRDVEQQNIDARVWIGFHYRNSVEQGVKLGNTVAEWALDHYFQRVR